MISILTIFVPSQAGAVAGTTVDLSLYPIDTLKTRLQSARGFYPSGGFSGIYAGVGSAVIGSAPSAALFFVTYEGLKTSLKNVRERRGYVSAGEEAVEQMISASVGEVAACAVRVPTEVVKQRAQASEASSSMAALRYILAQRERIGVSGVVREMYRGCGITMMREVPFTVIQFPLWEGLKGWRRRKTGREGVTGLESAVFGSLAGAVAAAVTTPLDVLKTRLMLARERVGMLAMLGSILRENGPMAIFAGIGPRVFWISAGGAVFLGSYQWVYNVMAEAR